MKNLNPLKKKIIPKMNLMKNKKVLLVVTLLIIIFIVSYKSIIIAQSSKLKMLTQEREEHVKKVSSINSILREEDEITNEWESLKNEKELIGEKYFSNLNQPEIIYYLNNIFGEQEIEILDMIFDRPVQEQIGEVVVSTMNISIPYEASYEAIAKIMKNIALSSKKILITDITIDKDEELLVGSMILKIYSFDELSNTGDYELAMIPEEENKERKYPFKPYDGYSDEDKEVEMASTILNDELKYSKELLNEPLRFEYNILSDEDENRAYIDVSEDNIILEYPPNRVGIWIYSYEYLPAVLGIDLIGEMDESLELSLTEEIEWEGWKYVEVTPTEILDKYPLKVNSLYLELPENEDRFGVILLDKLEFIYDTK